MFAGRGFAVSSGRLLPWGHQKPGGLHYRPGQRRDFGDRGDAGCLRDGAWILFSPAEAATWGGLPAILGYALGAAAPLLVFIPLGRRIRRMMPEGYTLTEYVFHRYGRGMYLLTLAVIPFYMFIFLAAEITSMALIANLVANVPLWITALIVTGATLAYTTYGGLKASIFTDVIQIVVIVSLLAAIAVAGYLALGGVQPIAEGLADRTPQLM